MTHRAAKTQNRLPELDLLRFVAAAAVVVFHWMYMPVIDGAPNGLEFAPAQAVARYGYLGVDLFFLISGFVISLSVSSRGGVSFLASRLTRLYPTFWACLFITCCCTFLAGQWPSNIGVKAVLINLTLIPGVFGAPMIDGVYWTLLVELKFYVLMFLVVWLLPARRFETALYVWLAAALAANLALLAGYEPTAVRIMKSLALLPFAQLFIAGALFFLVWRDRPTLERMGALGVCLLLAIGVAIHQEADFGSTPTAGSRMVTVLAVAGMFGVFCAMALQVWKLPASPLWHILGGMTYPLYLLHNQIGKVIGVAIPSAPAFGLRLVVSLLCVGLLTWGVTLLVERRWAVTINRHLQRLISDWSLDFTQRRQATPPDCHSLKLRIKTR